MEITAATVLSFPVNVPIDPANPCTVKLERIEVAVPVTVVWVLPPGYHFNGSGVGGLGEPDFRDGRFEGMSRRRFRWTARSPGSGIERSYSLSIEWIDPEGVMRSCVVPDLRIINRS